MRRFSSSLWGTTAWGTSTAGYQWKHDSASSGTATHPVMTVHSAQVALKYRKGMDPPFVVITSYPVSP